MDILFVCLKGGSGAMRDCDGYNHIGMIDASGGVLDQDYEMFEHMMPHSLIKHEFLCDSAGAARQRGGLGVETIYRVGSDSTLVVAFGDGDIEPAFGLAGGTEGTLNKIELRYPEGRVVKAKSKDLISSVTAGTVYLQHAGGAGGYGPPMERPVERVRQEVRDGILSLQRAREVYGVSLDPETCDVLAGGDSTAAREAGVAIRRSVLPRGWCASGA